MPNAWQALLLIYRQIDAPVTNVGTRGPRFQHELSQWELDDAVRSFSVAPALLTELSAGEASMVTRIVFAENPLRSLSRLSKGTFWPSPDDVADDFHLANQGAACHSLFVFWPQNDAEGGRAVPTGGWGLGMGPGACLPGTTYATVANAPTRAWNVPRVGEVWLHEWLHGACRIFAAAGCPMPDGDADGGGRYGYRQSPTTGWCDYYRDLMTGGVLEDGVSKGITADYWRQWHDLLP